MTSHECQELHMSACFVGTLPFYDVNCIPKTPYVCMFCGYFAILWSHMCAKKSICLHVLWVLCHFMTSHVCQKLCLSTCFVVALPLYDITCIPKTPDKFCGYFAILWRHMNAKNYVCLHVLWLLCHYMTSHVFQKLQLSFVGTLPFYDVTWMPQTPFVCMFCGYFAILRRHKYANLISFFFFLNIFFLF